MEFRRLKKSRIYRCWVFFMLSLALYLFISLITPFSKFLLYRSIDNQIEYLNKELIAGQDNVLQRRYPEGKVFSNALFALSIVDYLSTREKQSKKFALMVDRSLDRLLSESTSNKFSVNLEPSHGAFYNGWVNFTLKKYVNSALFEFSEKKTKYLDAHKQFSLQFNAIQSDSLRILDSYFGANWPGDNMACIASLPDDMHELQLSWLALLKRKSMTANGLIYHSNSDMSEARGSSQALILYFMSEVDMYQTITENEVYRDRFVSSLLNIDLVQEYANGQGRMDIDSGPILWGYGAVATIMNTKTQSEMNLYPACDTWSILNALGVPINVFGKKFYLFKKEMMFDIFMLWSSVSLVTND